jgi:Rps23 Pro-64 3,4-dihydroxylase Tpa1-like proline 4-hydroxylase
MMAFGHLGLLTAHSDTHKPGLFRYNYYFRSRQDAFTGGDLLVFGPQNYIYPPDDNSLILFAAELRHQVLTVYSPSLHFADSRFSLTGGFPCPMAKYQ